MFRPDLTMAVTVLQHARKVGEGVIMIMVGMVVAGMAVAGMAVAGMIVTLGILAGMQMIFGDLTIMIVIIPVRRAAMSRGHMQSEREGSSKWGSPHEKCGNGK